MKKEFRRLEFGYGGKLFSYKKLLIRRYFFLPFGSVYVVLPKERWRRVFFFIGGNLAVLGVTLVVNLFLQSENMYFIVHNFNIAVVWSVIGTLIPIRYLNGHPSDGKQILALLKDKYKNQESAVEEESK